MSQSLPGKAKEIQKALDAATPGPWLVSDIHRHIVQDRPDAEGYRIVIAKVNHIPKLKADAHLIANAPTWLHWQQTEIERITKERSEFASMYFRIREEQVVEHGQLQQLREELEHARKAAKHWQDRYDGDADRLPTALVELEQVKKERDQTERVYKDAEGLCLALQDENESLRSELAAKDKVL